MNKQELAARTVASLSRAELGLTQRDLEVVRLRVGGLRGPQIVRQLAARSGPHIITLVVSTE